MSVFYIISVENTLPQKKGELPPRAWVIGLPLYSQRIQCDHHYEHQMSQDIQIQLFENAKVRYLWDEEKQQYFFSVVDVIQVLTDSSNPQTYWRVLKKRLSDEGNETVTNCNALKMPAPDGKMLRDKQYITNPKYRKQ